MKEGFLELLKRNGNRKKKWIYYFWLFSKSFLKSFLLIFFLRNTAEFRLFSSFKIKQSERRTPSHRSQLNRRHLWWGSRHYLAMVWSESNREPMQRRSYISRANTVVLLWLNQLTLLPSQPHFCLCGRDMMCPVKIKVDKCYRKRSISLNFSGRRSAAVQAWSPGVKTWTSTPRFGTPLGHFLLLFVGFVMFLTFIPPVLKYFLSDEHHRWLHWCNGWTAAFLVSYVALTLRRCSWSRFFCFSFFLTVLCDIFSVSLNFFQCRVLNKLYVK